MTTTNRLIGAFGLLSTLTLLPAVASAQDEVGLGGSGDFSAEAPSSGGRYPLAYSSRPLTVPARTLGVDGNLAATKLTVSFGFASASETYVTLLGGATYGVTDDLQVFATILPLLLSPDFDIGNISGGAIYRFMRGSLELGAGASILLPLQDGSDFAITAGVPVLLRVGPAGRIDTGFELTFSFSDPTITTPRIPFTFSYNVNEALAISGTTGIAIPDFDFDNVTIPLGVSALYALPGPSGPMLDIGPFFAFPAFLVPGSDGDKVFTNLWTLGVAARFYMFM